MRAEFFTPKDQMFATVAELQEVLDAWVGSTTPPGRTSLAVGGRPLSGSGWPMDPCLPAPPGPPSPPPSAAAQVAGKRPAGVSRWVNAAGRISLAGFTYSVGATYAAICVHRPGLAGRLSWLRSPPASRATRPLAVIAPASGDLTPRNPYAGWIAQYTAGQVDELVTGILAAIAITDPVGRMRQELLGVYERSARLDEQFWEMAGRPEND
jgi:hypothetical protein